MQPTEFDTSQRMLLIRTQLRAPLCEMVPLFVVHMVAAASVGPVAHPVFLLHASAPGIKKFVETTTSLRFVASTLPHNSL